jgi:outer membrane lipoprotein
MRKLMIISLIALLLSCTSVIRKDLMEEARRDVPFSEVSQNPDIYKGSLFILGGIIVSAKATSEGSLIEAIYVPVNSRGYLKDVQTSTERYLALYPKKKGFLDPEIYSKNRQITVAAELTGTREGKIDELNYRYSLFEIREIYLWPKELPYYYAPPYPYGYGPYYPYYPYWWGDPWWRYRYPYPWYPY